MRLLVSLQTATNAVSEPCRDGGEANLKNRGGGGGIELDELNATVGCNAARVGT
jgi:hypothetical protein